MSKISTAGRRGDDVRSDCWASFEPLKSGGVKLEVSSRVESMFGDSIRELCREALAALEVKHCRLTLEDAGALPWVIGARIEAAVRRSYGSPPLAPPPETGGGKSVAYSPETGGGKSVAYSPETGGGKVAQHSLPPGSRGGIKGGATWLPELKPHCTYGTARDRFRRSRLYLPGNEPKFFINAGLHKPDAVILDLEDSVAPAEKDAAQILVRNALRQVDFRGAERMVRINQGERGLQDLEWVVPHNVHVILIPKCESADQVKAVEQRICELQTPHSALRTPHSEIFLMPIIESALGGIKAYEIATASPNIVALAIGLEDYTADLGVQRTLEGRESFWLRTTVVNVARAAGVQPIDTVFSDVADMEGLKASVCEAKALGFDGKGCIHPRQIAPIHEAFAPDPKDVERARKIVAAFEEAEKKGLGVVALGSKMIDPPVVKRALRTLKLAGGK